MSSEYHEATQRVMKYIFSAIGGSGSSYLINVLSRRYVVGDKPDTVFSNSINGLKVDQGTFEERSNGFKTLPGETLEDLLPRYVTHLRNAPSHTAVFNLAAQRGLFSKLAILGVVFLVRHPLHAYVSWSKPERHKQYVDSFGGVNSMGAVRFYANRWRAVVAECLRLREANILGGLVRFEHAHVDASVINDLAWVFDGFDSSKRNFGVLDTEYEEQMRDLVASVYFQIYDSWSE